jgi:TetR/AcrR family transcriptional repressor of nem operon
MPIHKTTPAEIIKQSIVVFRANGYYRTTMNDLAHATGLTKGVFYHHFTNKEDVMKKALQATAFWFDKHIFSIAEDELLPAQQRLIQMTDVLYNAFTRSTGGCFFANTILETAHVEDTFLPEINYFFQRFDNALSLIFKGKYQGVELENVVQQTIAEIEGTIILMQLKKDPSLLKKALNNVLTKLD